MLWDNNAASLRKKEMWGGILSLKAVDTEGKEHFIAVLYASGGFVKNFIAVCLLQTNGYVLQENY